MANMSLKSAVTIFRFLKEKMSDDEFENFLMMGDPDLGEPDTAMDRKPSQMAADERRQQSKLAQRRFESAMKKPMAERFPHNNRLK